MSGVSLEELTPDVSLTDDLAADSLDLLELALAIEHELGITIPERILEEVRTYGELVHATFALVEERLQPEPEPVLFRSRVVAPGRAASVLERAGWLTPHAEEMIAEDALRAGRGAYLSVTVAADAAASMHLAIGLAAGGAWVWGPSVICATVTCPFDAKRRLT